MKTLLIALILLAVFAFDTIIVAAILYGFVRNLWKPLADQFPARPPGPEAVVRNYQSFSFGLFNLGMSVHVAVDEHHLHLTPAAYLRWVGARALSVPWEAIATLGPARLGTMTKARMGSQVVAGPTWCLELATPAPPDAPSDSA